MDSITVQGTEEVKRIISGITDPKKRRRGLYRISNRLRINSRNRISSQTNLSGSPFKPRSPKTPPKLRNKKMERKLRNYIKIVFVNDKKAIIGFSTRIGKMVANRQQKGVSYTVRRSSAKAAAYCQRTKDLPATTAQAKKLLSLGFTINGKRPTERQIKSRLTQGAARWLIRKLGGTSKSSWSVVVPARTFLGINQTDMDKITEIMIEELTSH